MLNSVMSFVERQWVLFIIILHIFKIWSSGHMYIENTEFVMKICKLKLEFHLCIVCVTLGKINFSNLLFSQRKKIIFFSMTAQGIRNMIEKNTLQHIIINEHSISLLRYTSSLFLILANLFRKFCTSHIPSSSWVFPLQ